MTNLKWLNVDGTAGTGKSFLIWAITRRRLCPLRPCLVGHSKLSCVIDIIIIFMSFTDSWRSVKFGHCWVASPADVLFMLRKLENVDVILFKVLFGTNCSAV
jgi:hypothetical protein